LPTKVPGWAEQDAFPKRGNQVRFRDRDGLKGVKQRPAAGWSAGDGNGSQGKMRELTDSGWTTSLDKFAETLK
jgi:hypothetical protein